MSRDCVVFCRAVTADVADWDEIFGRCCIFLLSSYCVHGIRSVMIGTAVEIRRVAS